MKYVNRRGDAYYVFQGVTKTGKPKYYVSRKAESAAGIQIDSLPEILNCLNRQSTPESLFAREFRLTFTIMN
ncbi:MAG: hypothetical protein ACOVLE_02810 [Pirellula staleyi]